jgi:hypothetical protein
MENKIFTLLNKTDEDQIQVKEIITKIAFN